jgi:NitT/TauT family transport system substrate-binding protein
MVDRRFREAVPMRVLAAFLMLAASLAGAQAADKVRVTIPVFSEVDYAPFYLGTDKGYYAAEGLDVALVGAGGGVATPALISGDVQFSGSPSAAISAILKGAPLKIVYVMRDRPPYQLWASDAAIKMLADLKGKQVGVVSRGDTHENSVRLLLMAQHIDPNAVAFTALGFGTGRVAALNAGSLPAASLTIEDIEQLKRTPNLHMVADTSREVQMLVGGIAVNDRMLKADRPLAIRFMRALLKGERYMRSNEAGTITAMLTHNPNVARETVEKLYRTLVPGNTADGTIPAGVQQQMLDLYAGILGLPKDKERPIAEAFDFSLLAEVDRSLDAEGWKPQP